jgi:hypothetical protein
MVRGLYRPVEARASRTVVHRALGSRSTMSEDVSLS